MSDVSKVGFPEVYANMTLAQFKEFCSKHGFTGGIEAAYKNLCKRADVKPKLGTKKKVKNEEVRE